MSINHQSPGDALRVGLIDAAVGTAAGFAAQKISGLRQEGRIGYASHKLLHAALGAVGGAILAGPKGAVAGAIGAAAAEIGAEAAPEEPKINSEAEQKRYQEERSRAANIGKLAGATTTLLMHQDVGTAVAMATYAVENNFLTSSRRPASFLADFDEDADVLELNDALNDEMNESEFMRYLARERTARSMTFKLDSRGVPGNAWEHLAEDRGSVTPPGGLRRTDDNTFMPLWSLEKSKAITVRSESYENLMSDASYMLGVPKVKMLDDSTSSIIYTKIISQGDDILRGGCYVVSAEINHEPNNINFLGKIGKTTLKALDVVGRQVNKFANEYPGAIEIAGNLFEVSSIAENYTAKKMVQLIGKEQEFATNRNNIGSALESVQKDFVSYYNRKCGELSLNKDDQAGVVTLGFLALGTTRGGAKWATKSRAQNNFKIPSTKRSAPSSKLDINKSTEVVKHPGPYAPNRELPQTKPGVSIPDPEAQGRAYTQLGTVTRPEKGYSYTKAREFDEHGKAVRDIEFTDHARKDHPNPHQHQWKPNETGGTPKRGNPEPLNTSLKKVSKDTEALRITPKPNSPSFQNKGRVKWRKKNELH